MNYNLFYISNVDNKNYFSCRSCKFLVQNLKHYLKSAMWRHKNEGDEKSRRKENPYKSDK